MPLSSSADQGLRPLDVHPLILLAKKCKSGQTNAQNEDTCRHEIGRECLRSDGSVPNEAHPLCKPNREQQCPERSVLAIHQAAPDYGDGGQRRRRRASVEQDGQSTYCGKNLRFKLGYLGLFEHDVQNWCASSRNRQHNQEQQGQSQIESTPYREENGACF